MSEKNIQSLVMCAASQQGSTIFRCNTGNGVAGSKMYRVEKAGPVMLQPGDWVVRHGSRIQYGLTVGGSDLIGWHSITITQAMVGRRMARFLAIEVKTPTGKATDEQKRFIAAVNNAGGIAGVVRSPDEAIGLLNPLELIL